MPLDNAPEVLISPAEKLNQLRQLLDANHVPRPHIMWLNGEQLAGLMRSIGKIPFHKDPPIIYSQHYRYNLEFNRYYAAQPWKPSW